MSQEDALFGSDDSGDEFKPPEEQAKATASGDDGQADLEDDLGDEPAASKQAAAAGGASLFGSDDEDDDDRPQQTKGSQQQRKAASEDGDDEERGTRKQPIAVGPPLDVSSVLVPVPPPGSLMLLRTSNIMSIQPRAFDPATFELEQEVYEDSSGRQRVRLAGHAVVRWRVRRTPDGREIRESNTRVVKWEDGSMQLLLGDEVLDIAQQDMRANSVYLFKQVDAMLQGQGALTTKVALRPSSLDSGLHKRLREVVDKKHGAKKNKVELALGMNNPELESKRLEQAVEEKIRGRTQLAKRQDRSLRAYGGGTRGTRPARLSNQYLEEEQEWEVGAEEDQYDYDEGPGPRLTADQRARLNLTRNRTLVDDNAEADMGRRLQAAKRGGPATRGDERRGRGRQAVSDEEDDEDDEEFDEEAEEEEAEYESSGDEEEGDDGPSEPAPKKAKAAPAEPKAAEPKAAAKPRRKGVVLSDDDD